MEYEIYMNICFSGVYDIVKKWFEKYFSEFVDVSRDLCVFKYWKRRRKKNSLIDLSFYRLLFHKEIVRQYIFETVKMDKRLYL